MSNTQYGIKVINNNVEIENVQVIKSEGHCLDIVENELQRNTNLSITNCRFSQCEENGVNLDIYSHTDVEMYDATVDSVTTGIYIVTRSGSFLLSNISVSETTAEAVDFSDGTNSLLENGYLVIEHSLFNNCTHGVRLNVQYFSSNNVHVRIDNNNWKLIESDALVVEAYGSQYEYEYEYELEGELPYTLDDGNRSLELVSVDIALNTFDDICGVYLTSYGNIDMVFHDNIVKDSSCTSDDGACLFNVVMASYNPNQLVHQTDVSTNVFINNTGGCVVKLDSWHEGSFNGTFVYNQLLQNDVSDGVVNVYTPHFAISQNLFDNPETFFDVYARIYGGHYYSCTL